MRINWNNDSMLNAECKRRNKCWADTVRERTMAEINEHKPRWDKVEKESKCGYCGNCFSRVDFQLELLVDVGELIECSAFMD